MSAAPGLEQGAPRASGARSAAAGTPLRRPPLALVPARRPSVAMLGRTPFVALVVTLLAAGLLGLLVLNTALAQDAFRLHTLKEDSRALEDQEQALLRQVEALRSPRTLAERATALGMVPAGPPAFLRLPDGTVLGGESAAAVGGATAPASATAPGPASAADGADGQVGR